MWWCTHQSSHSSSVINFIHAGQLHCRKQVYRDALHQTFLTTRTQARAREDRYVPLHCLLKDFVPYTFSLSEYYTRDPSQLGGAEK